MKLLYIYNLYQEQGGENLWFESEPDLFRAKGHEVFVYRRDNSDIRHMPAWRRASLFWQAAWSQQSYEGVRSLIRKQRPDVAHVYNTLVLLSPSVYYACRDEGVPVVQSVYNYRLLCPAATLVRNGGICEECPEHSLWRAVRYGCYRGSRVQSAAVAWMLASHRRRGTWADAVDLYLAPTRFVRLKLIQGGIPAEKIVIKPNWHEPDPGMRKDADGSVLFVGKLSTEKGLRTVLRAWRLMSDPPLLRVIGDGPLRDEVQRAAAESTQIEFLGRRPHAEVIAYLHRASVFLIPSEWYEAFPHTILEGYACGVPIVASRIGTLEDVIADGKTGLLFPPGDAAELANRVKWLLARPNDAMRIAAAGRFEYDSRYRGSHIYESLLNIYSQVCKPRCSSSQLV